MQRSQQPRVARSIQGRPDKLEIRGQHQHAWEPNHKEKIEGHDTRPMPTNPSRGVRMPNPIIAAQHDYGHDEETSKQVAGMLLRAQLKTAVDESNSLETSSSTAQPPLPSGAIERQRKILSLARQPKTGAALPSAGGNILRTEDFVKKRDLEKVAAFMTARTTTEEDDEELALVAHESALREQMEAVARRQSEIRLQRCEDRLRAVWRVCVIESVKWHPFEWVFLIEFNYSNVINRSSVRQQQ